jgi:hypothetical protein
MTLYLGITSAIQDNESNDTNECKRKTFMMAMFPPNNKQRQRGESDFRQESEVTMGPFSRYQVINHGRSIALLGEPPTRATILGLPQRADKHALA